MPKVRPRSVFVAPCCGALLPPGLMPEPDELRAALCTSVSRHDFAWPKETIGDRNVRKHCGPSARDQPDAAHNLCRLFRRVLDLLYERSVRWRVLDCWHSAV